MTKAKDVTATMASTAAIKGAMASSWGTRRKRRRTTSVFFTLLFLCCLVSSALSASTDLERDGGGGGAEGRIKRERFLQAVRLPKASTQVCDLQFDSRFDDSLSQLQYVKVCIISIATPNTPTLLLLLYSQNLPFLFVCFGI